ncbi:hypothetical protein [Pseudomonas sp. NPDC090201]|uniref:hypothetical protein n=1 Tax=Pseudomonas sp. NPDC090201 TaxID=3364475 RepID=UPI00380C90DE
MTATRDGQFGRCGHNARAGSIAISHTEDFGIHQRQFAVAHMDACTYASYEAIFDRRQRAHINPFVKKQARLHPAYDRGVIRIEPATPEKHSSSNARSVDLLVNDTPAYGKGGSRVSYHVIDTRPRQQVKGRLPAHQVILQPCGLIDIDHRVRRDLNRPRQSTDDFTVSHPLSRQRNSTQHSCQLPMRCDATAFSASVFHLENPPLKRAGRVKSWTGYGDLKSPAPAPPCSRQKVVWFLQTLHPPYK